jgi:hypothetical protein
LAKEIEMSVVTLGLIGGIVGNVLLGITVIRLMREIRQMENRWAEHVYGRAPDKADGE